MEYMQQFCLIDKIMIWINIDITHDQNLIYKLTITIS